MKQYISLKAHWDALNNVSELIEYYKTCKGEREFSKLICDDKYVVLIALQIKIFNAIRKLEKNKPS